MAGSVKAIDRRSVHQICSGQVVLNLATAIKELVENSLDAGATNVEIKLKEYGSDIIEVSDNGSGVEKGNFAGLTLKHHTSKLQDFSDLSSVDTFGFRGEALSSLCALSDLSILTCHKSAAVGTKLTYDHDGHILKQVPCPRQHGTTVTLQNVFYTLPVRHKEFLRNLKKEFAKMVQVLQAYCIIASGVKLTCTNQPDKGKKSLVVSTNGTTTMRENVANVFGSKQLQSLLEFNQCRPSPELCEEYGIKPEKLERIPFSMSGFVSKSDHGQGRSTGDRQYFFINRRPCDFPKVSKLINEVYHMYNRHQYPFVVLDISLAKDAVDVNVTPDKRKVLVQEEKTLLAILKASLQTMFEPRSSTYEVNQKPLAGVTPSSASLATMFGRSPVSSSGGAPGQTDQKPVFSAAAPMGSKLNLSNLKRSFAHANHQDDTPERNPKQPKLDNFFHRSTTSHQTSDKDHVSTNSTIKDSDENRTSDDLCRTSLSGQGSCLGDSKSETLHDSPKGSAMSAAPGCVISFENPSTNVQQSGSTSMNSCVNTTLSHGEGGCTISTSSVGDQRSSDEAVHTQVPELRLCKREAVDINCDGPQRENSIQMDDAIRSESDSGFSQNSGSGGTLESSQNGGSGETSEPSQSNCGSSVVGDSQDTPNQGGVDRGTLQSSGTTDSLKTFGEQDAEVGIGQEKKIIIHRSDESTSSSMTERREVTVPFSFADLRRTQEQKESGDVETSKLSRSFRAKIAPSDNTSAEEELSKEISKDMFAKMEILGQFNLGFIIAKLGRDLFIIDQHATDEKFNFETLQKHNVLQGQKLIQPLQLELTAVNESILIDNLEIFKKNGFDFIIDEDGPPTQRVKLVSQPTSRNWSFSKDDIDELIFMLSDAPGVLCRPTRVRQMFASRACRKSIMIGTALNKADMKKLVCHMGDLDQPWNCPHGRPTMRHLFNLNMIPD